MADKQRVAPATGHLAIADAGSSLADAAGMLDICDEDSGEDGGGGGGGGSGFTFAQCDLALISSSAAMEQAEADPDGTPTAGARKFAFFTIVSSNPADMYRHNIKYGSGVVQEVSSREVAVQFYPAIRQGPGVVKLLDQPSQICYWVLPEMPLELSEKSVVKWEVERTEVGIAIDGAGACRRVLDDMVSARAFPGADGASPYELEHRNAEDRLLSLQDLERRGFVEMLSSTAQKSKWLLTPAAQEHAQITMVCSSPSFVLQYSLDGIDLSEEFDNLSTFQVLQLMDRRGWTLVELPLGHGARAIQDRPCFIRGGEKLFYHQQSLKMINKNYMGALLQAEEIFVSGHVDRVPHGRTGQYYAHLRKHHTELDPASLKRALPLAYEDVDLQPPAKHACIAHGGLEEEGEMAFDDADFPADPEELEAPPTPCLDDARGGGSDAGSEGDVGSGGGGGGDGSDPSGGGGGGDAGGGPGGLIAAPAGFFGRQPEVFWWPEWNEPDDPPAFRFTKKKRRGVPIGWQVTCASPHHHRCTKTLMQSVVPNEQHLLFHLKYWCTLCALCGDKYEHMAHIPDVLVIPDGTEGIDDANLA